MTLSPSAHVDTFPRESLPPEELWPTFEFTVPEVNYPDRLNAGHELLDATIARYGEDRLAFHAPDTEVPGVATAHQVTYGELRRMVDQVAHTLVDDYGVVPGNRVVLRIPNNIWAVVCWLAVLKVGAVVVTTMVAWRDSELVKVTDRLAPTLTIADPRYADGLDASLAGSTLVTVGGDDADDLLAKSAGKPERFDAVPTAADDVALLGPTSGTTGLPKVTMHFHRDILANADTFARYTLGLTPDDVSAGSAPFAFTFGLGAIVVFPLRFGGAGLLLEKPSPLALAESIETYGVTVLATAPTGYRTILKEGYGDKLRRLRIGVSAGEHLSVETFDAVEAATGLRLVNGLGGTEMLHVFISASGEEIRPGATGKPIPGFRAKLIDDDGNEVGPGVVGRLAVVGPTGCRYLNDDRQTVYVRDGWNVTGDAYLMDDDGYLYYQARTDDMIVASGYNIAAPEVEGVLDTHPAIAESAVVGRPDPEKGAIVNAFVVLRDGFEPNDDLSAEIIAHVRDAVATYKAPRRIDYIDALPRNASGKVQRFPLRERAAREERQSAIPAQTTTVPRQSPKKESILSKLTKGIRS